MKQLVALLGVTFFSLNALALPILTESDNNTGHLATLYKDHQDPDKAYFLPNRGRLQTDARGVPEFGMGYWGITKESTEGGGFFAGIFNLFVGGQLQSAIDQHLKYGKKVALIPVQESYVHFMERDGKRVMEKLFEETDLPPFAGRAEDSFSLSASLTKNGARMLAAQLRSGAVGADLNYCYLVTGLSPIFHAKIKLNYHKVYTHFLTQFRTGRWFWKANVRVEVEKLIESKNIKIEINGGDAKQADYVMAIVDRLMEKFFVPELQNRTNSAGGRFGISTTIITEDREQVFELTQREKIDREFCVGLSLGQLKDHPELIVNVDEANL